MTDRILTFIDQRDWDDFLEPNRPRMTGIELIRGPHEGGVEAMLAAARDQRATALVTGWSTPPLPADLLARWPGLRYLCHLAGTVRARVPRVLIERGLMVSNWADAHAFTVAEHALTLTLAGMRRLGAAQQVLHHAGGWAIPGVPPRSLRGRRVGLHGFGAVAKELVKLLAPLQVVLSAFAPGDAQAELDRRGVARAATVDELYRQSEVLICLAPLNAQTQGSIGAALFALLPDHALFVNVGRGLVVDEPALVRELASGRIFAGLDVYAEEPLPVGSPLRALTDVVLSPHLAGPTEDQRHACGLLALENLHAFTRGQTPRGVIDLPRYDAIT